jgi:hypothetical protein
MVDDRPLAVLAIPPLAVDEVPLAVFFSPPLTVATAALARLPSPPPIVEWVPWARLFSPPPMAAKSPLVGMLLFLPPLTTEKLPYVVLSAPWLTAPLPRPNATPVVMSKTASTSEIITSALRFFIINPSFPNVFPI